MPRDHARIHTDIWGDDEWRDLSPQAQHLYFVLYTGPPSFCGGGDWQPRKLAARARGWVADDVDEAASELQDGLFLLLDLDTDEYLLRSWIKHDGLYRVQNMAVSMANSRAALASRKLRGVVVFEVLKLRETEPKLDSWNKDAVSKMLGQTAVDPSSQQWPSPWVSPSVSPKASPCDSGKVTGQPSPSPSGRATPSPAPAPNSSSLSEEPRKRGVRLEPEWMPSQLAIDEIRAECPHVDFEAEHRKFVDYWTDKTGKDATKVSWEGTWRNWMRRASEQQPSARVMPTNGHAPPTAFQRKTAHNAAVFNALGDQPNRPELLQ